MPTTNVVPQALFGPGILWLTRTDIANATPINIGYINEFTMDASYDTKQLYGQKQAPLLVARGTAKLTGKMKAATLSGQALNAVLMGGSWTAGKQYDATVVSSNVSTGVPYHITPTIPSSGTFDKDLGVLLNSDKTAFTYTSATAPTTKQYSLTSSDHTYHFNAAQKGLKVDLSFAYSSTSSQSGQSMEWDNQDIGTTPTFQLDYKTTLYGATYYLRLFECIGGKTAFSHKLTDFMMPEYDFEFSADQSGRIGIISLATQN